MASVDGDRENSKFLVGTFDVKQDNNELHLVEFDEEKAEVTSQIFRHPYEIWGLSACPTDKDLFFSIYKREEGQALVSRATLWRLPQSEPGKGSGDLVEVCTLDKTVAGTAIKTLLWDPSGDMSRVVSASEGELYIWSLGERASSITVRKCQQGRMDALLRCR